MIRISKPNISYEARDEALDLLRDGVIDPGFEAEHFAQELADFWDVPRAWVLLTNSCTTAITLAAEFMDPPAWDTPLLTWPGTYCGLCPTWYVNDDYDNCGVVRPAFSKRGQMIVDLFGQSSTYKSYGNKNVTVIIDAAHNLRGNGNIHDALTSGVDAICFSFAPLKEITTLRGGALVAPWAFKLESKIRYGTRGRKLVNNHGMNGTMTEVGAAIGRVGLKNFDRDYQHRQRILRRYKAVVGDARLFTKPSIASGHLAVLQLETTEKRDIVRDALHSMQVETGHHYPINGVSLNAKSLSDRLLTVPCHLDVKDYDMDFISCALGRALKIGDELPGTA